MQHYDVVVCGLGVTGSAALYHLARRGHRVLGIDRFPPGHDRGSSHGASRIIRLAYFEHPSYVPLVRDAYAQWRRLQSEAGRPLLHVTGIVEIGPADGALIRGTRAAAQAHDIPHEILSAAQVMQRFPAFRLPAHFCGVTQADGGYLEAEAAVAALQALADRHRATRQIGESIRDVTTAGDGVRVRTDRGTITAASAILAAGAWTGTLLPHGTVPLRVTRQVMAWFEPIDGSLFAGDRFPVFLMESVHGVHYGFPADDRGVKIAKHHHQDEDVEPDHDRRAVTPADENLIRAALIDHLPAANGRLAHATTCLYTVTPDHHFAIGPLPGAPAIIVASACSGHGFKFAPVIGEIAADLATGRHPVHDIRRFRLDRFSAANET